MALFEGYERKIDKINGVLAQYGLSSVEECRTICTGKGFDPYEIVKGIQPIAFEDVAWAYCVGAAIAIKKGVKNAAEAAEAIGIARSANKARKEPLRVILNGLGKDAAQIISRINGFTYVQTKFDYYTGELTVVNKIAYSKGERAAVNCYGCDDVREGVAIITYYKGGVREDGAEIKPNDDAKIIEKLQELWATGDTQKVAEGVLAFDYIWHEDLNKTVPGLAELVKKDLDLIQEKGMLEAVKTIL